MAESRIPKLTGTSKKAANTWLTAMHKRGLLYCLDNDPADVFKFSDGSRLFSDEEASKISKIIARLFEKRSEELHELAFEIVSKTFHTRAEQKNFKTMHG